MAVNVTTTPTFTVLSRQKLFEGRFSGGTRHASYDISRDGKSFLMLKPDDDNLELIVVSNWLAEPRARTASGTKR
jgi:hypothetical protein